jgi:hypothetical protein
MRGVKLSLRKGPHEYQCPGEHAMYMSGRAKSSTANAKRLPANTPPPNALINVLIHVLSHSTE